MNHSVICDVLQYYGTYNPQQAQQQQYPTKQVTQGEQQEPQTSQPQQGDQATQPQAPKKVKNIRIFSGTTHTDIHVHVVLWLNFILVFVW